MPYPILYRAGTEPEAGHRSAIIYTIVESCKRYGINPQEYLARRPLPSAFHDQPADPLADAGHLGSGPSPGERRMRRHIRTLSATASVPEESSACPWPTNQHPRRLPNILRPTAAQAVQVRSTATITPAGGAPSLCQDGTRPEAYGRSIHNPPRGSLSFICSQEHGVVYRTFTNVRQREKRFTTRARESGPMQTDMIW